MSFLYSAATRGLRAMRGYREGGTGDTTAKNADVLIAASDTRRSLIGEQAFEEQFLRCQICHGKFDQAKQLPKSLPCNHTFCLPCLTQIFKNAQPPGRLTRLIWTYEPLNGTVRCPTCRVEAFFNKNELKKLPNDHRVFQMMDFFSKAVTKCQNVCSKHDRQPLSFFCKKCLTPVCRDCTVLDHKESDDHKIVDLSEAINENLNEFNDMKTKNQNTFQAIKTRANRLSKAMRGLDILENRLNEEIQKKFSAYFLHLKKRERALTSKVHLIAKEEKAKVSAIFVHVRKHEILLQTLYDECNESRKNNDVCKLVGLNQQMKEHENQFSQIATQNDDDLFQSFEFEAVNEDSFLSDVSSLGEVRNMPDPNLAKSVPSS